MEIEAFKLLMQEVGPLDDNIDAVIAMSDDVFSVQFERVAVDLEFDEASQRIMLSAEIGVPSTDSALKAYEVLMAYSLAWRQTGGLSVGLNGARGPLILMLSLFAAELTPRMLTTVVVNMADRALTWRAMMQTGITDELAPTTFTDALSEAMLRV